RRRAEFDDDRPRGNLRAGPLGDRVRRFRLGDRPGQRLGLRPGRSGLDARHQEGPPRGSGAAGRHGLDQYLQSVRRRFAVRGLQVLRLRPRVGHGRARLLHPDQERLGGSELGVLSEIIVERRGPTALITLHRPDSLNALTVEMSRELHEALEGASELSGVHSIVITGSGRAFCSGGDITFMQEVMGRGGRFEDFRALVDSGREIALALQKIEKPVIAAVNGAAAGGGMSLALACDVRWASENAKFGQSFVRIGLHPDWGALHTLPRMIGTSRALEVMWTGDLIDAPEAH